ncbi:DUF5687 family protein [Bacteroides helcogenes]|uniref:Transmembrane protein n=1 Tax=Bacteroides helcogenes (strain ATCC 35417 / DSM 20613 / JCM 6297 / CCUG 15421 / P 36-108) TaxID=693979 RepID=E6SVN3_BACT6|nr:DUF5687 family protein [Bacteroides helcogenes]ADV43494.1 hypothetical protein Bache_1489 [Bacteroides helcogenes P 36-108]MDY5239219.1 DUF5687 family protein [Bacteroides helcogenes]
MNLFLVLRKHGKLADKRNPMYEKSRFAKFWIYLMTAFWAGYLIFFGTTLAFAMQSEATEPYHILNSGLLFILAVDFITRMPFQKTPTQEVKPYILLPIKRSRLIDSLLIRSGLDLFNLFWFFFFVPFAIITITRFYGIAGTVTYLLGIWLLMLANNYWFLLCRTLMSERFWWLLLPVGVYGAIAAAMFIPDKSPIFSFSTNVGEGFIQGNPLTFAGILAVIILLYLINRNVVNRMVYNEINKVEDTTVQVKHVSEYRFLERYGQVGEYMKLELKLLLRNKVCKRALYSAGGVVIMFSALIAFTDAYQGGMKSFLVMYNFVLFGLLFLSTIMGYEGNYIDGLMSRKESIYALLQAKYATYTIGQIIPLLLMIPAMVMGKVTLLTGLSWFFFIPGFVYFCMFQMAVYNNKTVDMNNKMTQRNIGTGMQNLISFAAFGVPLILLYTLQAIFDETVVSVIFITIGLAFIATSRFWLHNVYHRFMKRRYRNMEGFRDSRQK